VPNQRGDKRRTVVIPDYEWDVILSEEAHARRTSKAKVIIALIRGLRPVEAPTGSGEEPAEPA
jgi:hypothetical protein